MTWVWIGGKKKLIWLEKANTCNDVNLLKTPYIKRTQTERERERENTTRETEKAIMRGLLFFLEFPKLRYASLATL